MLGSIDQSINDQCQVERNEGLLPERSTTSGLPESSPLSSRFFNYHLIHRVRGLGTSTTLERHHEGGSVLSIPAAGHVLLCLSQTGYTHTLWRVHVLEFDSGKTQTLIVLCQLGSFVDPASAELLISFKKPRVKCKSSRCGYCSREHEPQSLVRDIWSRKSAIP
jgi:hypothetical protein